MPDFDLDQFKESWQKENSTTKYNQTEILQMLNKKSRNYVKYILWISILEFLFISGMNLYYLSQDNEHENFTDILIKLGVKTTSTSLDGLENIFVFIKILSIGILILFVILFYTAYKKINIEADLKNLIIRIIKFKKTVNLFIYTNIFFLVFSTILFMYSILQIANHQNVHIDQNTLIGLGVGVVVGLGFSIVLIWAYYKIVYGIIISKLSKNLEQLQTIEKESDQKS